MTHPDVHPVAALFPALEPEAFARLKADIALHGVQIPVLMHRGKLLDGRNRWRACQELGIECPAQEWNGTDPWYAAQSLNLARRHLAADQIEAIKQKAIAAGLVPELAAVREGAKLAAKQRQAKGQDDAGAGGRGRKKTLGSRDPKVFNGRAADEIASEAGVSSATLKRVQQAARLDPGALDRIAAGEISAVKSIRESKLAAEAAKREALRQTVRGTASVRLGDFRTAFDDVADDSVALIFTDPPYDRASVPLYADLAELAARVLTAAPATPPLDF